MIFDKKRARPDNKKAIMFGAFDLIHPGYIHAFMQAKNFCDELIIGLHIDPSIENGKRKPVMTALNRRLILESIRYTGRTIPYETEEDLRTILKLEKPRWRILGEDYMGNDYAVTGNDIDSKHNTEYIYCNRDHGWSTTKLKKLIYDEEIIFSAKEK